MCARTWQQEEASDHRAVASLSLLCNFHTFCLCSLGTHSRLLYVFGVLGACLGSFLILRILNLNQINCLMTNAALDNSANKHNCRVARTKALLNLPFDFVLPLPPCLPLSFVSCLPSYFFSQMSPFLNKLWVRHWSLSLSLHLSFSLSVPSKEISSIFPSCEKTNTDNPGCVAGVWLRISQPF